MALRIPSLDGLRAVAILMVLVGHSAAQLPIGGRVVDTLGVSTVGVAVFFALSGYLITRLLLDEGERDGRISLRAFYVRRFFRIVPAYYVYLTCIWIAGRFGYINVPRSGVLPAYLFTWNYAPWADGWFYAHSWSLSMEEQFYLLWAPLLALLGRARAFRLAIGIVLLAPLFRLVTYALLPAYRGQIAAMLHTHGDALMFGAIPALGRGHQSFERPMSWLFERKAHVVAALVLPVNTVVGHVLRGGYSLPIGWSIQGCCIGTLIVWLVQNPESRAGRVLNTRVMIFVGSISYSLYLWQQAFLHGPKMGLTVPFPFSVLLAFLAAWTSYRLVELPALRIRNVVLSRLALRRPAVLPGV